MDYIDLISTVNLDYDFKLITEEFIQFLKSEYGKEHNSVYFRSETPDEIITVYPDDEFIIITPDRIFFTKGLVDNAINRGYLSATDMHELLNSLHVKLPYTSIPFMTKRRIDLVRNFENCTHKLIYGFLNIFFTSN